MALHTKILLGLVVGAVLGIVTNLLTDGAPATEQFVSSVTEPIGRVWLNALIMVVIPLIVSTLSVGIAGLGSLKRLGRIGVVAMLSFLSLTALSTILGLTAVNLIKPGEGLDASVTQRLMDTYQGDSDAMGLADGAFGIDLFVRIVPRNPVQAAANGEMLAVIFFALMIGVGLTIVPKEKGQPLLNFLESLGQVTIAIIGLAMKVAPLGVACLIFSVTARFGFEILFNLLKYIMTVVGSLAIFFVVGYSLILRFVAKRDPIEFMKRARVVILTGFSTSSSNATLPTTMRVAREELGISKAVAGFVLPLGATMNMNGTALFEGVTVLFIAQVFGVNLSLSSQLIVILMSVVTAIGVAGVPGGSIPLLMMVLGIVGVPVEGIAIVLGVDRILDMCRTTLNVGGDLVTASIVDRFEGGRSTDAAYSEQDIGERH
ncbi:MAG TPA: dicarboxylate/amino acid:cation symporter [Acidobacteria bacterium]|jgi:DAACS family dicarboxylate/amino acid:cation (Na+ or H+) symporter|nr:dicarboxylate/amino acid:cation symporter [Acidobacteriota bacterium]